MNILVIAPHPDDDIIGCGGSMAKHVSRGHHVRVVYVTSGDAGSITVPKTQLAQTREKEATDALSVLGITDYSFLHMPDGYVAVKDETLQQCIELIRTMKPDMVYIPHANDAHRDHKRTHKLFMEAVRRAGDEAFQECKGVPWRTKIIVGYEVWTPLQEVTYTEDISVFIDKKIEALKKHVSQVSLVPYDDCVKGLNRYRGGMSGMGTYCESFQILRATSLY